MILSKDFSDEGKQYYRDMGFDDNQIQEIQLGFTEGMLTDEQIAAYAQPSISADYMHYIRGIAQYLDIEPASMFNPADFTLEQAKILYSHLSHGYSTSHFQVLANPALTPSQMNIIQDGIRFGFDEEQMEFLGNPKFSDSQMAVICQAFNQHLTIEDVSFFADSQCDEIRMNVVMAALVHKVDLSILQEQLPANWKTCDLNEVKSVIEDLEYQYSPQNLCVDRKVQECQIGDTFPVYAYQYDPTQGEIVETIYVARVVEDTVYAPTISRSTVHYFTEDGVRAFPYFDHIPRQPIAVLEQTMCYLSPSMDEATTYFQGCIEKSIEATKLEIQEKMEELEALQQSLSSLELEVQGGIV